MNQYNNDFQYYTKENEDWLKEKNLFEKALKDIESIKGIVRNLINSNTSKKEIISDVFELDSADSHYLNYITAELKKEHIDIIPTFNEISQTNNHHYRNLIRVRYQPIQDNELDR